MPRWLLTLSLVAVMAVGFAVAQDEKPKTKAQPKTKKAADSLELDLGADPNPLGQKPANKKELLDKISYAVGMQAGRMKQKGFDLDPERVTKGMKDALEGKEAEFTDDEIGKAFAAFEMMRKKESTKVRDDFLETNKDKEGVKSLPSGLQYKVLATGKGASPKMTDTVRVHYRGKQTDGKVFDQSYAGEAPVKRDQPAEFSLKKVVKGFSEALTKMKPGDKWQIYVPPDLAFGDKGSSSGSIGPNSVLIFDLELIEIVE